jgi:NAD(P)-dependent dehydrogenase (short-subunit alcohol dehydrogenase family)
LLPNTLARKAIDAFGAIDILVNNAAFQRSYDKFEDISDDEFEETFRVNVFAMFRSPERSRSTTVGIRKR